MTFRWMLTALLLGCFLPNLAIAGDELDLAIATTEAPDGWEKKEPRVNIIRYEYHAPKVEGDPADARMTVMAAGGTVKANIERWYGQFTQPDGGSTEEVATVKEKEIDGFDVTIVDISGTYKDQRGPFAPAKMREDYRMLGAIIPVREGAAIYFKMYGPKKTMDKHDEAFMKMIEGIEKKK